MRLAAKAAAAAVRDDSNGRILDDRREERGDGSKVAIRLPKKTKTLRAGAEREKMKGKEAKEQ